MVGAQAEPDRPNAIAWAGQIRRFRMPILICISIPACYTIQGLLCAIIPICE